MTLVCVSDPGDELESIYEELGDAKRALNLTEAAYEDGRVVDIDAWLATVEKRRQRVVDLEERLDHARSIINDGPEAA